MRAAGGGPGGAFHGLLSPPLLRLAVPADLYRGRAPAVRTGETGFFRISVVSHSMQGLHEETTMSGPPCDIRYEGEMIS